MKHNSNATRNLEAETMATTQEINGRVLKKMRCVGGCGQMLEQWVRKDGGVCCCQDCRDAMSREANGWTPANSRD